MLLENSLIKGVQFLCFTQLRGLKGMVLKYQINQLQVGMGGGKIYVILTKFKTMLFIKGY